MIERGGRRKTERQLDLVPVRVVESGTVTLDRYQIPKMSVHITLRALFVVPKRWMEVQISWISFSDVMFGRLATGSDENTISILAYCR